ncbi:MAG: alpha-amylase family protein [Mycetocola sp.]
MTTMIAPDETVVGQRARTGWWSHPFQMFQTNLREIDAGLDVDDALTAVEAHGAGVWLLNVGGILSHYPTDLTFQTRNPALAERASGDLVGDAITAAHRRGIKLLARMDFSKITPRIADEHPDWCFRSASGSRQVYEGLVSVCPSGEYYQDRTLDILDEILDRYPVDGFFFNWFGFNEVDYGGTVHGVCHCDACRAGFTAFTGIAELPTTASDESYLEWKRFAGHTIDALTDRIRRHIHARNPEAGLILGRSADILFHEANNALGRTLWPHATSESVSAFRVAQPEKAVLVNAVTFYDMPYRMASEQPEMFTEYLVQAIARGANPSTYIMGPPDGITYDCLPAAAEVTRFHRDHAAVYDGMAPAASVGLLRPDPLSAQPHRHAESVTEFRGWFVGLMERHIPFDVVPVESVGTRALSRFGALIAPDLSALTPTQDAALQAFVEDGGVVIATGATGIRDDGSCAGWLPGSRQTGTLDDADALKSSYLQLHPADAVEGSALIARFGRQHALQWKPDTQLIQRIIPSAPYGPPEKAYGHEVGDAFACGIRELGAGRVVQLGWLPGAAYAGLLLTSVRDAAIDLVTDSVVDSTPVIVDAPEQVEVILGRSSAGLVVHLLNHSGQRRNGFGPVVPIHGIRIGVPGAGAVSARALGSATGMRSSAAGDELVLELDVLHAFAVVVIEDSGHGA